MKKYLLFLIALGLTAATMSPVVGHKETRYMSRVFAPDNSYEIQVSTVMRTYTRDHQYLPLIIQVHNIDANSVSVSPGQFQLQDADGNTIRPITPDEYFEHHKIQGRRNIKYLSKRADNGIETKAGVWYIERSRFYPLGTNGGVYDDIRLRPNFYMVDWLYFPKLEDGDYKLIYQADSGQDLILPVRL